MWTNNIGDNIIYMIRSVKIQYDKSTNNKRDGQNIGTVD